MVFVLDRRHNPLMPCSEKRARLLLARGRAVVHAKPGRRPRPHAGVPRSLPWGDRSNRRCTWPS
jgi:hypothetical protein